MFRLPVFYTVPSMICRPGNFSLHMPSLHIARNSCSAGFFMLHLRQCSAVLCTNRGDDALAAVVCTGRHSAQLTVGPHRLSPRGSLSAFRRSFRDSARRMHAWVQRQFLDEIFGSKSSSRLSICINACQSASALELHNIEGSFDVSDVQGALAKGSASSSFDPHGERRRGCDTVMNPPVLKAVARRPDLSAPNVTIRIHDRQHLHGR